MQIANHTLRNNAALADAFAVLGVRIAGVADDSALKNAARILHDAHTRGVFLTDCRATEERQARALAFRTLGECNPLAGANWLAALASARRCGDKWRTMREAYAATHTGPTPEQANESVLVRPYPEHFRARAFSSVSRFEVYFNLHKRLFSVRAIDAGRMGVVAHVEAVTIADARLVVREAGRARVLQTGQKNVHAFVRGRIVTNNDPCADEIALTYNPRKHESFVTADGWRATRNAQRVRLFLQDGRPVMRAAIFPTKEALAACA